MQSPKFAQNSLVLFSKLVAIKHGLCEVLILIPLVHIEVAHLLGGVPRERHLGVVIDDPPTVFANMTHIVSASGVGPHVAHKTQKGVLCGGRMRRLVGGETKLREKL